MRSNLEMMKMKTRPRMANPLGSRMFVPLTQFWFMTRRRRRRK